MSRDRQKETKKSKVSFKKMFGSHFVAGSWSVFAAVLMIVIAVVANLVVGSLPSSTTQIDMSGSGLYDLSDQTRRIASSLEKDVTLYLIASNGQEDATIVRLLERYADLSSHIRMETVDPAEKPTFLNGYDLDTRQLYQNSVLVDLM